MFLLTKRLLRHHTLNDPNPADTDSVVSFNRYSTKTIKNILHLSLSHKHVQTLAIKKMVLHGSTISCPRQDESACRGVSDCCAMAGLSNLGISPGCNPAIWYSLGIIWNTLWLCQNSY